jgi:uncharacterized protein (DUF305 family)
VNKHTGRLTVLLVLVPAVALAAWRQDSHTRKQMTMAGPDWTELMRSMDKMHTAMSSVKPSDDSDLDFVKLMLPHHQAAIDMAKTQLLYGKDPQMRRLAQEIVADQQSEIELMQLWLKQHDSNSQQPN